MSRVRTRFAPSPTGSLHVGNARTAVLNWLVARHHGGDFVLRIEDTDAERNVEGAEARLMEDLRWLGLDWDEGPDPAGGERGPHAPYHQSDRGRIYQDHARRLLDSGSAYRCFCSAETLESERERALEEGRPPGYAGTCRGLDPAEAAERAGAGEPHVLRLATPDAGEVVVDDLIRGRVTFDAATLGDFVLVRSDGVPTYNFAVVVDDATMEITHVVRGAGHLSNTPHQLLIYRALGYEPPAFAHAPTVLGADRSKLSKRSGARPLAALREEGFHPDAVLNYLSLLGWSSPSGEEILTRDRLIREVTLARMNAGDVVFDPEKMRWLSERHIAAMEPEALVEALRPRIEGTRHADLLDRLPAIVAAVRSHLSAFGDITAQLDPFLGPGPEVDPPAGEAVDVVAAAREAFTEAVRWEADDLADALRAAGKRAGARGAALYVPVRLATTGQEHGPPLPAILAVQGRAAVLEHLDRALERAAGAGLTPERDLP